MFARTFNPNLVHSVCLTKQSISKWPVTEPETVDIYTSTKIETRCENITNYMLSVIISSEYQCFSAAIVPFHIWKNSKKMADYAFMHDDTGDIQSPLNPDHNYDLNENTSVLLVYFPDMFRSETYKVSLK